ncbi:MAG: hypothetical protein ACU0DH_08095 [Paracoccus sp. (in: a-proteobacteria)]|uniref:hypothetical protein n=1 Tax=Paracoccus sp. TaxID=267 RepID=UPI004059275D
MRIVLRHLLQLLNLVDLLSKFYPTLIKPFGCDHRGVFGKVNYPGEIHLSERRHVYRFGLPIRLNNHMCCEKQYVG